jgi:hypothetical protein
MLMTKEDVAIIQGLRQSIGEHREEMIQLQATFQVWQQTRCQDHHERMLALEESHARIKIGQAKLIAKAAGAAATIVGIINGLTLYAAFIHFKDLIGG